MCYLQILFKHWNTKNSSLTRVCYLQIVFKHWNTKNSSLTRVCYLQIVFKHWNIKNSSSTVRWCSPDIQLWVPLLYCGWLWSSSFSYLMSVVVFIDRYRSLDFCTTLSGKVSLQILLCCSVVVTCFVVLSAVFPFLVVGLVLQRGCECLLLGDDTVWTLCPILLLFTVLWPLKMTNF